MAEISTKVPLKTETKGETAVAHRAWQPFESLHDEIDRLFDEFTSGWPRLTSRRRAFEPFWRRTPVAMQVAVEVGEDDKAYTVTAELPGLDQKDIEVALTDDSITIKGEKKEEKEEKKKDYYLSERSYGSFQRSFTLPADVDHDKIAAQMNKGVLTVTMPKSPEAQKKSRKLEIKTS
jgi:HSP20 family protein